MNYAEKFDAKNYITDLSNYERYHPRHSLHKEGNHLAKYEILFKDGSKKIVIMTSRQRVLMNKKKEWPTIQWIIGLGYQKRKK